MYVEANRSSVVPTKWDEVAPFAEGMRTLDRIALTDERSAELIQEIKEELPDDGRGDAGRGLEGPGRGDSVRR